MARVPWPRSFGAPEPCRPSARDRSRVFWTAASRRASRVRRPMTAEQETSPERRTAPTGPDDAAVSRDPGTPDTAPDDASDLRGFHFRRLIRKRATWYWGGIP